MRSNKQNKSPCFRNRIIDKIFIILSLFCLPGVGFAALAHNSILLFPTDSYFDYAIGYTGPDLFDNPVISYNGIHLNQIQQATIDQPNIDQPFQIFFTSFVHETTSPISILSDDNSGNVTLDFSGWSMRDSAGFVIDLGDTGSIASMVCSNTCENGDSYSLVYSYYMGDFYTLRLNGTISAVPLPGTAWLFVSGLLSIGFYKRRTG